MGLFSKNKNQKEESMVQKQEQEQQYTCLFCKKKFLASEIIFGRTLTYPDPEFRDNIYNSQLDKYHKMNFVENGRAYGLVPISRRMIEKDSWEILKREENGLPLLVRGTLEKSKKEQATADDLSFSEFFSADASAAEEDEDVQIISSERLCPRCHFTLPEGFATDKVIQIGLLGGSRSGKTTYMAVVTEYLQKKMGILNSGLEMAQVELLPECQKYQEALYLHQRGAWGPASTAIQEVGSVDKMIMPIVLHVKPVNDGFRPFFLILQDIPGEYLEKKNNGFLLNSNIPKSTDLILLVDINHFIKTIQQDKKSEFGGYCPWDVNDLFANIDTLGSAIPQGQLKSVQCTLTKLDFWMSEEKERLEGSVFTTNCDEAHREGIDINRLGLVHDQINQLLNGIGGRDQSGLLDNLIKSMSLEGSEIHTAYTAVASRRVPGYEESIKNDGADYQNSLNVLEPLMNIFDWYNLVPKKVSENT